MRTENVVFLFILVVAAGFFALNVQRLVQLPPARQDRGPAPTIPRDAARNVLEIGIAQTKILRDPVAGPMHAPIFWGFMVLTAGTIEIADRGRVPAVLLRAAPARRRSITALRAVAGRVRAARARRDRLRATSGASSFIRSASRATTSSTLDALHHPQHDRGAHGHAAARERVRADRAIRAASRSDKVVSRRWATRSARRPIRAPRWIGYRASWWAHALLILVVPELPAVLEAPARHRRRCSTSSSRTRADRASGRDAPDGSRGGRRAVRRVRRRAPDVEEPARRLLLHRVRPLHRGVPGEHHRQAAQPAQDRRQHAPAVDGEGPGRDGRSDGVPAADARARRRRRRRAPHREDVLGHRLLDTLHHRGRALGVHELPRVRPRVPGVDRPARRHQRAAPQPGAHRVALSPRRCSPRSSRSSATDHRGRSSAADRAQVGRGTDIPTMAELHGARRASRHPVLGRLHGLVRRPREEDHRRVRAHPPGRAASGSPSSARKRAATAIPRVAWATSTSTRCSRRTRSRRSNRYDGAERSSRAARTASTRSATSSRSSAATTR